MDRVQVWRVDERRCIRSGPAPAFTLIEVMVVVGLIGLTVAIGLPPFVRVMDEHPLRTSVQKVVEGLGQARGQAILQGVSMEWVLRAADGEMYLRKLEHQLPLRTAIVDPWAEVPEVEPAKPRAAGGFKAALHPDVAVTFIDVNMRDWMGADEAAVAFHPNGTADDFTIVLEHRTGVRKVTVDAVTGLADVQVVR